ncbi:MAG: 30S ribosomal protein S13 [Candidatus Kerfeldbacteria bacterium]|nr:30S ribosomal protein S13 [Candidatus Kerfeldbacteria bacterium]
MPAARIAGVTLPQQKRIEIALTYIYGIGLSRSRKILETASINGNTRTHELTESQVNSLRDIIEKTHRVEGELRREILLNIKRLKEIGTYRGSRHSRKLPVRGQRTKTNTRTVRGNVRRTMGSGRSKAAEKT